MGRHVKVNLDDCKSDDVALFPITLDTCLTIHTGAATAQPRPKLGLCIWSVDSRGSMPATDTRALIDMS